MKRVVLALIVLAVFATGTYAQDCDCAPWVWVRESGALHTFKEGSDELRYGMLDTEATVLIMEEQYWAAIEKYKKMIEIEDCLPNPFNMIAVCYMELDMKYQAMEYYKKACDRVECRYKKSDNPNYDPCKKYENLRLELLGY
ncbi:MAG: hypothetical protein JW984_14460 [Deltaproteobacteria bacterium]|uniref:Tetratricopeptide repeat protein n=1 Tax=Candidatus Zymogenus saltonus TaxID=2844893 RepID=A0A9D8PPL1_9DELT|nr:hypothetical protein [Candidatus Zymogenus saltonus]